MTLGSGGAILEASASLRRRLGVTLAARAHRALLYASVPFFLVACMFTYYGQLNREQSGDTYGTIYTAVAIAQQHQIWLDRYEGYIEAHTGENVFMLRRSSGGHWVNATPSTSSLLALPVVEALNLVVVRGRDRGSDWRLWMEAAMLTAALTAAATVALMFVLLTRLTTRPRAALLAAVFAWGTLEWGISGQALWQHTGANLALTLALVAFVDRRLVLAGVAVAAMVSFRPSTPLLAVLLLPLVGRRLRGWVRFAVGIAPFALFLLVYNTVAFGSPLHQGYGSEHVMQFLHVHPGLAAAGISGFLISPSGGLFVYSPVLLFSVVGAVRGRRTPLYRWSAIAAALYVIVVANGESWTLGKSFGPRKLTDILPLLIVLLVPALAVVTRRGWRWLFALTLAWSVLIEVLEAGASQPWWWWNRPRSKPLDFGRSATWWHVTDNQIVSLLQSPHMAPRFVVMLAIFGIGLVLGQLASRTSAMLRCPAYEQPGDRLRAADAVEENAGGLPQIFEEAAAAPTLRHDR